MLKADTDAEAILEGFGVFLRRFPAMAKVIGIRRAADGSFSNKELQLAAVKAIIIRVELG